MKKTIKQRFFLSLCLLMLFSLFGGGNLAWAEGKTVTYTVSSTSAVTTSGTAPSGSSATFKNTCSTKKQLTKGDKMTLTLSGYAGQKITGLTLSMKSNTNKGAGYLDVKAGTKQLAAIGSSTNGLKFNDPAWNGKWSTSYVDVKVPLLVDTYIIKNDEKVVIVIGATANSLYCESFELTYEAGGSTPSITTSSSELTFGNVETSSSKQLSFTLSGQNLTADASLSITGTDAGYFSVAPTSVSQTDGTIAETDVTVTYAPTAAGTHTATLTIGSGTTIKEISLSGTGIAPLSNYNVSWMVNGAPYTTGNPSTSVKSGGRVTALPTEPDAIGSKVFVGWTNAEIAAAQPTAPTVLFTTPEDAPAVTGEVTYYAVFATQSDSPTTEVLSQTLAYDTWTYGGSTTNKGSYRLFHTGGYVQSKSFDLSTLSKVVVYGGTFGGSGNNKLNIGDGNNTWKDVTVSGSEETGVNTFTGRSPLSGEGVLKITSQSGTATGKTVTGVRISKVDIYTLAYSYTDYVTTISTSAATVTFDAGANGTCATASLTETAAGAGVTLPECVGNEGYRFMGWSTSETPTSADAGQAGETYYPSADCTLYAYYKQLYTVSIEEPANGTIEVKHGENEVANGDNFLAGDVLTITATPAAGYKFRNLQVEDGSTHTYTASNVKEWTMNEANITISAKFDEITYSTITKVVNGVPTTEQVENGTEISFTDPEAASIPTGYVFMGWTETPVVGTQLDAPTLVSSPVTASTDATYYAVFAVAKETTVVFDPNKVKSNSELTWEQNGITLKLSSGTLYTTGTPKTFTVYNGSTNNFTVTSTVGNLKQLTATISGTNYKINSLGLTSGAKLTTSGTTQTITFTRDLTEVVCPATSGNQIRLTKLEVQAVASPTDYCTTIPDVELAVGATGYATLYYSNFDLVVPENTEAYTFGSVDGALVESKTYAEGTVIPAGEAVVVYTINTVPCTLNFKKGIATLARDASSQLAGTDEETAITPDADYYFYGLSLNSSNDVNSVGFYWMTTDGAAFPNGAHKAYLKILKSEFTGAMAVKGFAFKGTTTGVESVESNNHAPQVIYDLAGRRVSKAEKGIYIINGKKVIK